VPGKRGQTYTLDKDSVEPKHRAVLSNV
jgi:hypothetical protein